MIVNESGFNYRWFHHGSGYATGPVFSVDHMVVPSRSGGLSVHTGLSRIQATNEGPLGAAIGIMKFGTLDFGTDPTFWPAQMLGNIGFWTTAFQVTKGEMTVWELVQVYA